MSTDEARSLWRSLPASASLPYLKENEASQYVLVPTAGGAPGKDMVAASIRGRSHAHAGTSRDDDFALHYDAATQWYTMIVADGAGSAEYGRKGSEIACDTAMQVCKHKLTAQQTLDLERLAAQYCNLRHDPESEACRAAMKQVGNVIYSIVGQAAFAAHKAIAEFADSQQSDIKDFATTLQIAICRKFAFGWFVATFWVGDGAICLLDIVRGFAKLLGTPDEGEFSGQTRFLTMTEVMCNPSEVYRRMRFSIEEDFTALLMLTDGVSDPFFNSQASIADYSHWLDFWRLIWKGFPEDGIEGVRLFDNYKCDKQLLSWLKFWKAGEHDDRTLAILY